MTDPIPTPAPSLPEVLELALQMVEYRGSHRHREAERQLLALDPAQLRALAAEAGSPLRQENTALREVARTLHTYSRRYCDGRSTYAPDDHNRATHTLLALGVTLDPDPISKTGPFASDGMYGLTGREREALARLALAEPLGDDS